ncbi:MAG: GatB/YqeY domain-containing protein [Gammaproteobacteria bacterium]
MKENIKASIKHEVSFSMKEGNKFRTTTLRLMVSAFQVEEINKKEELNDKECIEILEKMIKQRKDSISQFESAGREELSKKEKDEILIIQEFMPEQLSVEEIDILIKKVISETNAESMKDMGKVMGMLKKLTSGKADSGYISSEVKKALG